MSQHSMWLPEAKGTYMAAPAEYTAPCKQWFYSAFIPDNAFYLPFQVNIFRKMSELCCEVHLFLKDYMLTHVAFNDCVSFADF